MHTNRAAKNTPPELERLATLAALLDNRFRIPGTNIRFGLDALIGLIPYAGDLISLLVSGFLMLLMVRHGASPLLVLRMLGNYLIDTAVGTIPVLGDLFDIGFKANRRNVELLTRYYESGKPRYSGVSSILLLAGVFMFMVILLIAFTIWTFSLFFQWLFYL